MPNLAQRVLSTAAVVCALACVAAPAAADVKLANLFSNSMVLQQGTAVPVWGTAEAGEQVTVSVAGQTAQATADASGKWVAKLPALTAGGPHEMVAKGKNEVKVADVMVGEVWIASGQSNMEWPIKAQSATEQEKGSANHPGIRMFTVTKAVTGKPAKDVAGSWAVCTPQTIGNYSAVAYFFAKE